MTRQEKADDFDRVERSTLVSQVVLLRYTLGKANEALDKEPAPVSGIAWSRTPFGRAIRDVLAKTAPPDPAEGQQSLETEAAA